jgi:hypothetical protein
MGNAQNNYHGEAEETTWLGQNGGKSPG